MEDDTNRKSLLPSCFGPLSRQVGPCVIEPTGQKAECDFRNTDLGVPSWDAITFQDSSFSEAWGCYLKRDLLSDIRNKDSASL